MNLLDFAIVGTAVFGAAYGVSRGVLRMATSAASVAAGVYVASIHHAAVGELLQNEIGLHPPIAAVLGYVIVFAIIFSGVEAAGNILIRMLNVVHLNWADRLGGAAVGGGLAAVIAGLGITLLTAGLPTNTTILQNSRLAPQVLAYNQTLLDYMPTQIRDAYQVRRDELTRYWKEHSAAITH